MTRTLALTLALLAALASSAEAARPQPFFGVMADGPIDNGSVPLATQVSEMRAAGVETVRVAVYWSDLQPDPGGEVEFARTDDRVAALASQGIEMLPVVVRAPRWARSEPDADGSPPADPNAYARFLTALVNRYGPAGTLWAERPGLRKRPIRRWQVWNEPDLVRYFTPARDPKGWARPYVRLLRPAAKAIRKADPGATIVAAGLTGRTWVGLRRLYAAGAKQHFDVAAIHPFSSRPSNVLRMVELSRAEMRRAGDSRSQIAITEFTWSSAAGRDAFSYGWETTESGQAERIATMLPALRARRTSWKLAGIWWYSWISGPLGGDNSFDYSGLRRLDGDQVVDKPALAAYRAAARAR